MEAQEELEQREQADPGDELGSVWRARNMPKPRLREASQVKPNHKPKVSEYELRLNLADKEKCFEFTYNVQQDSHERMWLENSLGEFIKLGWISDVLRSIKGGKEASVYQCEGTELTGERFVAAKIYRPRMFRNLRNDHIYRQGRARLDSDGLEIVDDGMLKAIRQGTEYGRNLMHTSWIEHEFTTMQILYEAGADLPVPYARGDNAILMDYIGGDVVPAPTLNAVDLDEDEAGYLYQRSISNVELMLAHDRVHGDYSAYNILYWGGKISVIDFPQAINPHENRNAYMIFERDVKRICEYFISQGVKSNPKKIAYNLWKKYKYNTRPEVDPALLDAEDDDDVAYWKILKS